MRLYGVREPKRLPWHMPCWTVPILTAQEGNTMTSQGQPNVVPVRMYTTDSRSMLAAIAIGAVAACATALKGQPAIRRLRQTQ